MLYFVIHIVDLQNLYIFAPEKNKVEGFDCLQPHKKMLKRFLSFQRKSKSYTKFC